MSDSITTGLAVEAAKAMTKVVTARAMEEITLIWGFEKNLEKLKKRFLDIQAFLEDVGSGKHAAKELNRVNRWLLQIKEVAYHADNVMDDYVYEMLRRKIQVKTNNNKPTFKKKLRKVLSISVTTNPILFRIWMSHRVSKLLSKFDELDKEAKNIGLQRLATRKLTNTCSYNENDDLSQTRKYAAARGFDFVGRKHDEMSLLQNLRNPGVKEGNIPIIAIVGIGGLGKTTIARRLYEHDKVDEHFEKKKVWICVSKNFKVERILKEMVEALTSSTCDLANTGAIVEKLHTEVKKKFLLVLDDVWTENAELWSSLKNVLHRIGGLTGSVILITTRAIEVAAKAGAIYSHMLEGLSERDGWHLLKQNVLTETETIPCLSYFEDVGKRIVKKCKGVPLAIKAIRGLLQNTEHLYEWEEIERNELWNLVLPTVLPSLLLSYNHLYSSYVKQCFAYCAIFPKDRLLEKDELIAVWMAQGFLHDESETRVSNETMEIVGEKYLQLMVNYSFLQHSKEGDQIGYKMHDLVHDLATYISKKDLCVSKREVELDDAHIIRHLVFDREEIETITQDRMVRKLRTLSIWDSSVSKWDWLICARYLRTLIMANLGLEKVPSVVGELVHLRYLDLSDNYEIEALPESICRLYQLQTLRLMNCFSLRELPREIYNLANLRHIQTEEHLLAPRGLRQLTRLQTIPHLALCDGEEWTIDELELSNHIKGKMYITGLEHVEAIEEARKVLYNKDKVLELNLGWGFERETSNSTRIEDDLILHSFEPHPNIKTLRISGFNGLNFPSWILTMTVEHRDFITPLINLTEVELSECRRCQQLPTFGQLPFLRVLNLDNFHEVKCIGNEFYENTSNSISTAQEKVLFASLEKLHIKCFWKLTTWMSPSPALAAIAFPRLDTLEIHDCPELDMVPTLNFPSLRHLEIVDVGGTQPLDIIEHSYDLFSVKVMLMEKLTSLPRELPNCSKLQELEISCDNVTSIPTGLICLKVLKIHGCSSLTCILDDALRGMSALSRLLIWACSGLKNVPMSLGECTSLWHLWITDCPLIEGPTPNLSDLKRLQVLVLINSGELTRSMAQWISGVYSLEELRIGGFKDEGELESFLMTPALDLRKHYWLERLHLCYCPKVTILPQELQILLPTRLKILKIVEFEELEVLPDWIGELSSLQQLVLQRCIKLKHLPSKEVMICLSQLQHLAITNCPELEERCARNYGLDLIKISHIPYLVINGKLNYPRN